MRQSISFVRRHIQTALLSSTAKGEQVKKTFLVVAFTVVAGSASSQITVTSKPIEHYTRCINAAIAGTNLEKSGESIQFICHGEIARQFFAYLSKKQTFEIKSGGASYRARFMNNQQGNNQDFCWQQLEMADATPTGSKFGCQLYLHVGPFINE